MSTTPNWRSFVKFWSIVFIFVEESKSSSRAIVFAQFRDSIGVIVDALQSYKPMIRARYFVVQGKASGNTKKKDPTDHHVAGMKRTEQQKAIRQFKENQFKYAGLHQHWRGGTWYRRGRFDCKLRCPPFSYSNDSTGRSQKRREGYMSHFRGTWAGNLQPKEASWADPRQRLEGSETTVDWNKNRSKYALPIVA